MYNSSTAPLDLVAIRSQSSGNYRTEMMGGNEYVVVPVVGLVEGVLQGVTADQPELALAEEFGKFPGAWNGRPVTIDHPYIKGDDGEIIRVSASTTPDILDDFGVGFIFNTRVEDTKLKMEVWLDSERMNNHSEEGKALLKKIKAGEKVEVSTGLFTGSEQGSGIWGEGQNAERYFSTWRGVVPDHLALLPGDMVGACSIADGCGVYANSASTPTRRLRTQCSCGGKCMHGQTQTQTQTLNKGKGKGNNSLSGKASKEPYGNVTYADPGYQKDKKKRYPIDTAEHIRAAWDYINVGKNAKKYTPEQVAEIKSRIVAAWKRIIGGKGPPSAKANTMKQVKHLLSRLNASLGNIQSWPQTTAETRRQEILVGTEWDQEDGDPDNDDEETEVAPATFQAHPDAPQGLGFNAQNFMANMVPDGQMDGDTRQMLSDSLEDDHQGAYPYLIGFTNDKAVYSMYDTGTSKRRTYQRSFQIDPNSKKVTLGNDMEKVNLTSTITPLSDEEDEDSQPDAATGTSSGRVTAYSSSINSSSSPTVNQETQMTVNAQPGSPGTTTTTVKPDDARAFLANFGHPVDVLKKLPDADVLKLHTQVSDAIKANTANSTTTETSTSTSVVKEPTVDEYLASAPSGVREMLQRGMKMQADHRTALITRIKANSRNKFSDAQLGAMDIEFLENLAEMAHTVNYGGMGGGFSQDDALRAQIAAHSGSSANEADSGFAPPAPKLVVNNTHTNPGAPLATGSAGDQNRGAVKA